MRALDGITFAIEKGTIFALVGPNGAGKSTTVRVLTTLSQPDSGTATVLGIDVLRFPRQIRRIVGCVGQRSAVDLESTGRENLTLQGQLHGLRGRELAKLVSGSIDRFELGDAADRLARTYSGGMQQKLNVAMGLLHHPKVLFLDEPTTGLDPKARSDLWTDIKMLRDEGLTIFLTTHYLEEADRLAQRVAIVNRGRVVTEGTPEQLKAELSGDVLEIELREIADNAKLDEILCRVAGIRDVNRWDQYISARVDDGAKAITAVLLALESSGISIASVKVVRPSLDDVYLRHEGSVLKTGESRTKSWVA